MDSITYASSDKNKLFLMELYQHTIQEAVEGQYNDTSIETLILQKTGAFFEASFVSGWILGGGSPTLIEKVKETSKYFSLFFQISDDIEDMDEDMKNNTPNYAIFYGKEKAIEDTNDYLDLVEDQLEELGLLSDFFKEVIVYFRKKLL